MWSGAFVVRAAQWTSTRVPDRCKTTFGTFSPIDCSRPPRASEVDRQSAVPGEVGAVMHGNVSGWSTADILAMSAVMVLLVSLVVAAIVWLTHSVTRAATDRAEEAARYEARIHDLEQEVAETRATRANVAR